METTDPTPSGRRRVAPRRVAVLFGDALRERRHAAGMTQVELAKGAGLHAQTVSMLENAKRQPSLETLLRLCRVLGVSPDAVVGEVDAGWDLEA